MDYQDYQRLEGKGRIHFWHRARQGLVRVLLDKQAARNGNPEILDLGSGTGINLPILKRRGHITVLDSNQAALEAIKDDSISKIKADVLCFDWPDERYDVICAFDILEHLWDDVKVLRGIGRALKPDGALLLTVPAISLLYSTHDQALGHHRRYSGKELKSKLKTAGFSDIKIGYWNFFLFPPQAGFRLAKKTASVFRAGEKPLQPDSFIMPKILDGLFFQILNIENRLIKAGLKWPFGLSLYASAKKNHHS